MMKQDTWTGERLETFITGETMQEHLHRYAIAASLAKGKKVLDIACGEGYGAMLLAKVAIQVTAVDIDENTIRNAVSKYKAANITFRAGSILHIDAPDGSFDMISCLETLEHLEDHEAILKELKRVLTPGGLLFISTPEKINYSDKAGYKNPFHQKELTGTEFKSLLGRFFSHLDLYKQFSFLGSVILNEHPQPLTAFYKGDYDNIATIAEPETMYWLALASDKELPLVVSGLFQSPQTSHSIKDEQTARVKKTITYRTGHFILRPFKFIYSLFRK